MLPIVVFGLVRLFSQIFQMSPKGPPFIFFYFSKEWMFKNSQMPPFTIVGTMRLTEDQKNSKNFQKNNLFFPHVGFVEENTWHIEVLLLFLSLRYGADLCRSRLILIHKGKYRSIFEVPILQSYEMNMWTRPLAFVKESTQVRRTKLASLLTIFHRCTFRNCFISRSMITFFSRRFRRKSRLFHLASFFRQFNSICPLFLFICSTLSTWTADVQSILETSEHRPQRKHRRPEHR